MINTYYIQPTKHQHQKSFYDKCYVEQYIDDGKIIYETLYSYNTKIVTRYSDNTLIRHWNNWTQTTGKHIVAFCGLNKNDFLALKYKE